MAFQLPSRINPQQLNLKPLRQPVTDMDITQPDPKVTGINAGANLLAQIIGQRNARKQRDQQMSAIGEMFPGQPVPQGIRDPKLAQELIKMKQDYAIKTQRNEITQKIRTRLYGGKESLNDLIKRTLEKAVANGYENLDVIEQGIVDKWLTDPTLNLAGTLAGKNIESKVGTPEETVANMFKMQSLIKQEKEKQRGSKKQEMTLQDKAIEWLKKNGAEVTPKNIDAVIKNNKVR